VVLAARFHVRCATPNCVVTVTRLVWPLCAGKLQLEGMSWCAPVVFLLFSVGILNEVNLFWGWHVTIVTRKIRYQN